MTTREISHESALIQRIVNRYKKPSFLVLQLVNEVTFYLTNIQNPFFVCDLRDRSVIQSTNSTSSFMYSQYNHQARDLSLICTELHIRLLIDKLLRYHFHDIEHYVGISSKLSKAKLKTIISTRRWEIPDIVTSLTLERTLPATFKQL